MTGRDWLTVLVLFGVVVFAVGLDWLRRAEERRHQRNAHNADHARLMREVRRQP